MIDSTPEHVPHARLPLTLLIRTSGAGVLVPLLLFLAIGIWPLFEPFVIGTVVAGVGAAALLGRWNLQHPTRLPTRARTHGPEINLAAIPVSGDAGGLLFVVGSVAVVVLGLPGAGWYLLAALACGSLLALVLLVQRSVRPLPSARATTLGLV